jgi:hypothetical protein
LFLLVTMRRRNNYRGVHEFLSGTVTAALVGKRRRRLVKPRGADFQLPTTVPPELPERVGSFLVTGALRWDAKEKVLLAEDQSLGRKVWIWRRVPGTRLTDVRHKLNRAARLRWLATVETDAEAWECFMGPCGTPLPQVRTDKAALDWEAARPILEELADELSAGRADGTLPAGLTSQHVWIQPTGRLLVIDIPYLAEATAGPEKDADLALVREAAKVLLAPPSRKKLGTQLFAIPLPEHARRLLNRLVGESEPTRRGKPITEPFRSLDEFREVLRETHDLPIEVGRVQRGHQLALMLAMMHLPSMAPTLWFVLTLVVIIIEWLKSHGMDVSRDPGAGRITCFYMFGTVAVWCIWSFIVHGGLSYRLTGIHLRRSDGRKAARWQCALRVLLVWSPIVVIQCLALLVHYWFPAANKVALALWLGAVLLVPAYIWAALRSPGQALHDRILGVYLVPN